MAIKKKKFNSRIFLRTRRYILLAGVLVLALLGIIFFAIIPQTQEIFSLRDDIQKEKPRYEQLVKKFRQLDAVEITSEFQQKELIEATLPSKKPLLELLEGLNTAALASGIVVEEFNLSPGVIATESAVPTPPPVKKGRKARNQVAVQGMEVNFTIAGSFEQIQRFTEVVEQIAPFTTITSLELSNPKQRPSSDGGQLFTAEIVTETSYYTASITTNIDAPLPVLSEQDKLVLSKLEPFVESNLPKQDSIQEGGAEDLFKIEGLRF